MTSNPGAASASLSPVVEVSPLQAAVAESQEKTVQMNGHTFKLAPKLTVAATVALDTAQRESDMGKIVEAAAKLLHKDERERFLELLYAEPDDGSDIDLDTFLSTLESAVEGVVGRPTNTTGS